MNILDDLSESAIKAALASENAGLVKEVVYYENTDSTNDNAKLLGKQGMPDGTLVVADCQSAGKGRQGRSFESPKGKSIYMTLLLRPQISPANASMTTIVAAMAVRKALEEVCRVETLIKWPNDIVADGRKLCGILTEMSAEPDKVNYVVVGIGINVNNDSMTEDISNVAVSVKMLTGREYRRDRIIAAVMKWFGIYYGEFLKTESLKNLRDEYNKYLIHMGKDVEIIRENTKYRMKSLGIDDNGELIVERDGNIETVISGEVSVRGVYGYV